MFGGSVLEQAREGGADLEPLEFAPRALEGRLGRLQRGAGRDGARLGGKTAGLQRLGVAQIQLRLGQPCLGFGERRLPCARIEAAQHIALCHGRAAGRASDSTRPVVSARTSTERAASV